MAAGGYLLYLLLGLTGEYLVNAKLIVEGDPAVTANHLLAHASGFRLGFAMDILMVVSFLVVTLAYYTIFKPVNPRLSALAAWFSLTGCGLQALSGLFHLAPLAIVQGGPYLDVFRVEQRQALALLSLELCAEIFNTAFIFFAFYFILLGSLILKSTFLPRVLGILLVISGTVWLTFLSPPLADRCSAYLPIGALGMVALTLWMLLKGVHLQRWLEQRDGVATETGRR
jgi:hypothetical protein